MTVARFWDKVDKTETCWLWTGSRNADGYGRFWWEGKNRKAHRVAWVIAGNKLRVDLELDHLCCNRACVNPEHLQAVKHKTNVRRITRRPPSLRRAA